MNKFIKTSLLALILLFPIKNHGNEFANLTIALANSALVGFKIAEELYNINQQPPYENQLDQCGWFIGDRLPICQEIAALPWFVNKLVGQKLSDGFEVDFNKFKNGERLRRLVQKPGVCCMVTKATCKPDGFLGYIYTEEISCHGILTKYENTRGLGITGLTSYPIESTK